jgi:hypothetical protein
MWFNEGSRDLKAVEAHIADGDQLVITLHASLSYGGEPVRSDFTATRFNTFTSILTAPQRAVNFASAIKALVR